MRMRRGLQMQVRSPAGVLKNTADASEASVLCNRNQVIDSAAVRRHCKQLSIWRDSHVSWPSGRQRQCCPAQQRQTPILGMDMQRFNSSACLTLVLIDIIDDVQRLL